MSSRSFLSGGELRKLQEVSSSAAAKSPGLKSGKASWASLCCAAQFLSVVTKVKRYIVNKDKVLHGQYE